MNERDMLKKSMTKKDLRERDLQSRGSLLPPGKVHKSAMDYDRNADKEELRKELDSLDLVESDINKELDHDDQFDIPKGTLLEALSKVEADLIPRNEDLIQSPLDYLSEHDLESKVFNAMDQIYDEIEEEELKDEQIVERISSEIFDDMSSSLNQFDGEEEDEEYGF